MKNSTISIILGVVGTAGVGLSMWLSGKAAIKAKDIMEQDGFEDLSKKEKAKVLFPVIAPAAGAGLGTVICIAAGCGLSVKQDAALVGAYKVAEEAAKRYSEYRTANEEVNGEEADKAVIQHLMEKVDCEHQDIYSHDLGRVNHPLTDFDFEKEYTFIDRYSKRKFTTKYKNVVDAEYNINRNYVLGGFVDLNSFYEFIGIPSVDEFEKQSVGWDVGSEMYFIDFDHVIVNEDGEDCISIEPCFDPLPSKAWENLEEGVWEDYFDFWKNAYYDKDGNPLLVEKKGA